MLGFNLINLNFYIGIKKSMIAIENLEKDREISK